MLNELKALNGSKLFLQETQLHRRYFIDFILQ